MATSIRGYVDSCRFAVPGIGHARAREALASTVALR